jgi:hypothetical protein
MVALQPILIAGLGLVSIRLWLKAALGQSFAPYFAKRLGWNPFAPVARFLAAA